MRLLLHRLVIGVGGLALAQLPGCASQAPAAKLCDQPKMSSLSMTVPSNLGLSGAELRDLVVGEYTVTATGADGSTFPLQISVASRATTARQEIHDSPSFNCPSSLRIDAEFQVGGSPSPIEGAWDGTIIGDKTGAQQAMVRIRAEARAGRADFTRLPQAARRETFLFWTGLGSMALTGGISEVIEPANDGQQQPTESPLMVATWGSE